ncbi:MAG: non-heme iron oxygenase ferredoxin subunit [Dehalococcoidia bacterium]|nr:non-heme iron oxygenase ferredoxin subunit [Dehalococcoidia bacterium]
MARERIGAADGVPAGEVRVLRCAGGRELAVSNIEGTLYAIDDLCTHDGGTLGEGRLRNGRVICPRHGAAFDARTGKVITLPAVKSVNAYAVTVEDGGIYVDCDAPIEAPR